MLYPRVLNILGFACVLMPPCCILECYISWDSPVFWCPHVVSKLMLPPRVLHTLRFTCVLMPLWQRHELHGAGGQDGGEVGGLAGLQAGDEVPADGWHSPQLGSAPNDRSVQQTTGQLFHTSNLFSCFPLCPLESGGKLRCLFFRPEKIGKNGIFGQCLGQFLLFHDNNQIICRRASQKKKRKKKKKKKDEKTG